MNVLVGILEIAGGLIIAAIVIFILFPLAASGLYSLTTYFERIKYKRKAKKRNAESKRLRLARTDYQGWPLPTGKQGKLIITQSIQIGLQPKSFHELHKIYHERGNDLGVDIWVQQDINNNSIIITWEAKKKSSRRL